MSDFSSDNSEHGEIPKELVRRVDIFLMLYMI